MKTNIIAIGNSKGIRIPKAMLKDCDIEDMVEIEKDGDKLILKPVKHRPRQGWEKAFSLMHDRGEDALLLDEGVEDMENLEWK